MYKVGGPGLSSCWVATGNASTALLTLTALDRLRYERWEEGRCAPILRMARRNRRGPLPT
jgi:hypothetical protein